MENNIRKTKVIATFGPALKENNNLLKIIDLGVDVIRFNFSHLLPEQAIADYNWVKQVAKTRNKHITFLADLKGPEIRLLNETHNLVVNETIHLIYVKPKTNPGPVTPGKTDKNGKKIIKMDHPFLTKIITPKHIIDADDGQIRFKVEKVEKDIITCKVVIGGLLKGKKSLHISKFDYQLPILSNQDKANLKVIIEKEFSWIAASFIGKASDVETIRKEVKKLGGDIPIISKIESYHGIQNLDEIIEVSDGIMVARGDLGQEFPFEDIPHLQDIIVSKTKTMGKVCIIATQILNGMIEDPTPTRAEVTDIHQAVKDRVDAVMLSAETAAGKYPDKAVQVMNRVILKTEQEYLNSHHSTLYEFKHNDHFLYPLCRSALSLTRETGAKCLLIITEKGRGPIFASACRPSELTFVVTKIKKFYLRSRLYYSIQPILLDHKGTKLEYLKKALDWMKSEKILKAKDKVVSIYSERTSPKNRIDLIAKQTVK